ncbi:MAG: hypothetical protein AAB150_01255 [Pseudomonadota bacterium]
MVRKYLILLYREQWFCRAGLRGWWDDRTGRKIPRALPFAQKKPVALLKRHRLEDGIPKEEEEKPRK